VRDYARRELSRRIQHARVHFVRRSVILVLAGTGEPFFSDALRRGRSIHLARRNSLAVAWTRKQAVCGFSNLVALSPVARNLTFRAVTVPVRQAEDYPLLKARWKAVRAVCNRQAGSKIVCHRTLQKYS